MRQVRSGPGVSRWAVVTLVVAALATPAAAGAYYDGGGPAVRPSATSQLPTAEQIAEHRGIAPGAGLSSDGAAESAAATVGSGADGSVPLILGAVLLAVAGAAGVAIASRERARRSPRLGV